MYRRILVPLEREGSQEAHLWHATRLASALNAELHLIHVIPVVSSDEYFFQQIQVEVGSRGARRKEETETYFRRLEAQMREHGISVQTAVLFSPRPEDEAILEYAAQARCDLIVLPNLRRSLLSRWLQGNIPARVQRRSTIPVLFVSEEVEQ
ncbi:MAG: universal stress protein [Thermoflexia bacterium]|nr:MAG: universal stress protein [Thermoflexia bacterium]